MTEKMRQVWFTADKKIEVREVEVPPVKYGQVKIKTAYAALCASDKHMMTMGIIGGKPDMPIGHEASGVIVELGPGTEASGLKVGDKVVPCPDSMCGMCTNCKDGNDVRCTAGDPIHAFSDYIFASAATTFKLPADADLKQYVLTEPLGCILRAMELANVKHGDSVLITGMGGIGALMLNAVVLSGAAKITVSEPVGAKRENALAMGAQSVIDPLTEDFKARALEITEGKGYNHIFELSGVPAVAPTLFDVIALRGKITYFAVYPPDFEMPINLYDMYNKELGIQTVIARLGLLPKAIELIPRIQHDKIIGKVLPLEEVQQAFDLFDQAIYHKILLEL
jgi:2-desacetyl-2-hydroxyethyl bacteriochlorophyllide A dehydrogenase